MLIASGKPKELFVRLSAFILKNIDWEVFINVSKR